MFNYSNLNDVEFEELCKDIMEKILSIKLHVFAQGRDNGIDIRDYNNSKNIIIQVKHFINSKFSDLRNSLKKEIPKVEKLKPRNYFICCSLSLTSANIAELHEMFKNYMPSEENIITLKEIDAFLRDEKNIDIVRKHYKLWLESSSILNEISNQKIFIDCESLLNDIKEDSKYFVQTKSYEICRDLLEKDRLIMLIGAPGVGKTTLSKMLIIYFADNGFRVRYSSNGDISDIKNALSSDKDSKEIILLDDCLGQHYFKMKDSQENELLHLVKYIKLNPNKLLILNSRITIFNEAKARSEEFKFFIQSDKIKIHTINIDKMNLLEKAKIFYNRLAFTPFPKEYYTVIKANKNYMKIINHPNYTPRIIEYVTLNANYINIKPENYFLYIKESLDKPQDIWKNEFERRLGNLDRIFMFILYSLTDTVIDYAVLKLCFEERIKKMKHIDSTINIFEDIVMRLNSSMIKIFDHYGQCCIGVINPSVNDYLKSIFYNNVIELEEIRKSILYFEQAIKCYQDEKERQEFIMKKFEDHSILNFKFFDELKRSHFLLSIICKHRICDTDYVDSVYEFLESNYCKKNFHEGFLSCDDILKILLQEPLISFYKIETFLFQTNIFENLLYSLQLDDLITTINIVDNVINNKFLMLDTYDELYDISQSTLDDAIEEYLDDIAIAEFADSNDIFRIIDDASDFDPDIGNMVFDELGAIKELKEKIMYNINEELESKLGNLTYRLSENKFHEVSDIIICSSDVKELLDANRDSYDDDYYEKNFDEENNDSSLIEFMFESF